jgi:hypothetical protein
MKCRVVWAYNVRDIVLELPEKERMGILERVSLLVHFPYMYPVRTEGKRFRRHRWFAVGDWLVFYKVVDKVVYIRGVWPARIP